MYSSISIVKNRTSTDLYNVAKGHVSVTDRSGYSHKVDRHPCPLYSFWKTVGCDRKLVTLTNTQTLSITLLRLKLG